MFISDGLIAVRRGRDKAVDRTDINGPLFWRVTPVEEVRVDELSGFES
jgi:hypothetical protein